MTLKIQLRVPKSCNPRVFEVIKGRAIPDWKKFLSSGTNKQTRLRFIGDHILDFYASNAVLEDGQTLVLAEVFSNLEYVKKVERETAFDCVGLISSQEEADNRINSRIHT